MMKTFENKGVDTDDIACIIIVDGMEVLSKAYILTPSCFRNYLNFDDIRSSFQLASSKDPNIISEDDKSNCKFKKQNVSDEFAHFFMNELNLKNSKKKLKFIFCLKEENKKKAKHSLMVFWKVFSND